MPLIILVAENLAITISTVSLEIGISSEKDNIIIINKILNKIIFFFIIFYLIFLFIYLFLLLIKKKIKKVIE